MNEELHRLGEEYWEYRLKVSPTTALLLGDHRYDSDFERYSREAEDRRIATLRDLAERAEAVDEAELTADELISRDVLSFEARTSAELTEARLMEMAVGHTVGIQAMIPVSISQLPITEPEHAEAMLDKYGEFARSLDERGERLREGVTSGRTPMGSTAEKSVSQIDALLGSPVTEDPFVARLRIPPQWQPGDEAAFRKRLARAVEDRVRPAWKRYRDTIADDVLPAARPDDRPGLSWLADGEETYARAIHRYTTLVMDAREIHEIGRQQVARLTPEYARIGSDALGTSDLAELFARLRADTSLHFDDGPAVVAASTKALDNAKAAMGAWFGRLPRADCLVEETATGPLAFYQGPANDGSRPGTFYVNTQDPRGWATYEIEAIAYHEGIPGHHLQIAISRELEGVPMFRRHAVMTAYAEGWGLYSERLADEMGLYSSDLDRIGMLQADSMRACRLVVDTGIHALGWSRQKAIDYFAENSPMAISAIENEIDRYISMPGQALAYMIGRLEIQRMRADAEERLGAEFDIKQFHDAVLGSGLVPLETLDRIVNDWVAAAAR